MFPVAQSGRGALETQTTPSVDVTIVIREDMPGLLTRPFLVSEEYIKAVTGADLLHPMDKSQRKLDHSLYLGPLSPPYTLPA